MLQKLLLQVGVFSVLVIGIALIVLFLQPYEAVNEVMQRLGDGPSRIFSADFYSAKRLAFRIGAMFFIVFSALIMLFFNRTLALLNAVLNDVVLKFQSIKKEIENISQKDPTSYKVSLLLVLGMGVYLRLSSINYPFRYDEAFTYYNYVKSPVLLALSNYSYPNNHVFHTLLVKLSTYCFGDSLLAIRLPAVLAGIILLPLSYILIRKMYNKGVALVSLGVLSCAFVLIDYSVNARGYTILSVLFVLLLMIGRKKSRSSADGFWVVVLSALGLFTIPVFIFPFVTFLLWMYWKEEKTTVKQLVLYLIGTGVFTAMLYAPVMLYSGWNSVVDNEFIVRETWNNLPSAISNNFYITIQWFATGFGAKALYFLGVGLLLGLIRSSRKTKLLLWSLVVSGIVIQVLQRTSPPPRIWLFVLPLVIPFVLHGFGFFFRSKTISMVVALSLVFHFSKNMNLKTLAQDTSNFEYNDLALTLKDKMKKGDHLLAGIPIDYPFEYYMKENKVPFSFAHVHNGGYTVHPQKDQTTFVLLHTKYNKTPNELDLRKGVQYELVSQKGILELYISKSKIATEKAN